MRFKLIKHFSFRPTFWPTLATLILLPLFIWLGLWQWHRAEYKQLLLDNYSFQAGQTALSLEQALQDPEGFRYFKLEVQGHYLNQKQFLQENAYRNDTPNYEEKLGCYAITPFLTDSGKVILVNRGWVPKDINQSQLQLSENTVTLKGRVSIAPTRTFYLGENIRTPNAWPCRIQVIKIKELSDLLGQKIEPVILLLNPQEPHGFVRHWQPQGLPPEKHRGYALQWFAFAALLSLLFIMLNLRFY